MTILVLLLALMLVSLAWGFLSIGNIFLISPLLIIIFTYLLSDSIKVKLKRYNIYKFSFHHISLTTVKESLIAMFIVCFFFKLELVYLIKVLSLDWLLPIVYGASGIILYILKKHISSSLRKNHGDLESKKLTIIFSISFVYTGVGILIFCMYNNYHDDLILIVSNFLDILFGFQFFCTIQGNTPYMHINDSNTLKMNEPAKDSSSTTETKVTQSRNTPYLNSNPTLPDDVIAAKVIETSKLRMNNIEVITRIDSLIWELEKFKKQKGVIFVEDREGSLYVDIPSSMDRKEADFISKKVNIIDNLFSTYSDTITEGFAKHDKICKELKAGGWYTEDYVKLMQSFKDRFKQDSKRFNSLIEKEPR